MRVLTLTLILLAYVFLNCPAVNSAEPINNIKNRNFDIIFTSEKKPWGTDDFQGYVIENNELYINLWISGKNEEKKYVFRFLNGELVDMKLSQEEAEKYFEQIKPMYDLDSKDNRIVIDENRYIKLGADDNPRITLIDGKKERFLQGYVFATPRLTYMYLDRESEKLYFAGSGIKKISKGYESKSGILIYDIKTGGVSNFALSEDAPEVENYSLNIIRDLESFFNPIRVPNTPYLLFFIEKRVDNKYFYEIAIKEVPEWKAEIEAKKKEDGLKAGSKKYFIDGPANLRDKPKGKNITGSIEDGVEIEILEQKGDWYLVKSADKEGWTFKDNLKISN